MGRKESEIINLLKKFKQSVAARYGVEKNMLFGSQAKGAIKESNDIDLIIVCRKKRKVKLLSNLYHEWHVIQEIGYPVDFLCYTPEEFEKLSKQITIVREAINEGIEI